MKRVALIGAGNVAWSLARTFDSTDGFRVVTVYSPHLDRARALTDTLTEAIPVDSPESIGDADIYIVALTDSAIATVAENFTPRPEALWVHTSGSVPCSALAPMSPRHGVFYPLQTFSRGRAVDLRPVTIFTEAPTPEVEEEIAGIARRLSDNVMHADSTQRSRLHTAAVFACNFANHLWAISGDILTPSGIPFSVMGPLIKETLDKALSSSAADGQTGPARRGDMSTIAKHIAIAGPVYGPIYRQLSDSIIKMYRNDEPNQL